MVTEKIEEQGCESERESYNVMGVPLTLGIQGKL